MSLNKVKSSRRSAVFAGLLMLAAGVVSPVISHAEITPFKQALAVAAAQDEDIAEFYRDSGYAPLWTGAGEVDRARRAFLLKALGGVEAHGLPASRYAPDLLMDKLQAARTDQDRARLEVELSRVYLRYARDMQSGILIPSRIDPAMVRQVAYGERQSYLEDLASLSPAKAFRKLPPRTIEYNALLKEKLTMERLLAAGGWGPTVPERKFESGDTGPHVVALRNRLIRMGFMPRTNSQVYDAALTEGVKRFQEEHGLNQDGVAGPETLRQLNKSVETRLKSVIVAMERERWLNLDRGKRHVLVNIPDFSARIVDDGRITFSTRSVVGATAMDRRTPEFSDVMEHMVVNPSWYVPRSIATKEYLPKLKKNPYAVSHIELTDSRGRTVNRGAVNFQQFTERTFPFSMREPPSRSNALGLVKFMFPNKYNIYLHDTPAKSLFSRDVRAFSHGCVRLADPFEFAYALLAPQSDDPKGLFHSHLNSGTERKVNLETPVPVHLIYRTAFTNARGRTEYRDDVYGRDALIWEALAREGVALRGVQG